jgi:hypothetical protein
MKRRAAQRELTLRATRKRLDALARHTRIARTEGALPEIAVDVHTLRTDGEGTEEATFRWGGGVSVEVSLFDHGQGDTPDHADGTRPWAACSRS